ncbi:MAG: hypothetical protein H0V54_12250 [Chthoniobacterales bacterium]|nr:hypothetical protein [Chthoniobacterales bacterium]
MKFPVINVQDPVGKTVGRRKLRDAWKFAMDGQKTANQLRRSFGHGGLCPKGVFRFRSHEEANAWMMKMLAQSARRSPS